MVAGKALEIGDGRAGQPFDAIVGIGDIARQRLPVEFNHFSGRFSAGKGRGWRQGQVVRIHPFQVKGKGSLGVGQFDLPAERDRFTIALPGHCFNQRLISRRLHFAQCVVG